MLTAFASQREAWPSWPLFGRQRTLNVATYCASVSGISAGQHRKLQVADALTQSTIRCWSDESERVLSCPKVEQGNRSVAQDAVDC